MCGEVWSMCWFLRAKLGLINWAIAIDRKASIFCQCKDRRVHMQGVLCICNSILRPRYREPGRACSISLMIRSVKQSRPNERCVPERVYGLGVAELEGDRSVGQRRSRISSRKVKGLYLEA
jgi:hypothetical protein